MTATLDDTATAKRFDFGLNAEQEARAAALHHESIVFDMLSQHAGGNIFTDYPRDLRAELSARLSASASDYAAYEEAKFWPYELSKLGKSDLLYEWYRAGGLSCGVFDLPVHEGHDPRLCATERKVARYLDLPWVRRAVRADDVREAKRAGAIAFYLNCQPVSPAPRSLKAFDRAYAAGLRSFMLTYNRMDNIGVGCTERVDAGLSMFGVQVIEHCNELGVMIDVSHCGQLTTMDACRHSKKPVNANHTSVHSIHAHARGKTDDALRAIADTGGIIGIAAVPFFLTGGAAPSVQHMLDHVDYTASLVGWRHVAIGTDWPLQAPDDILITALAGELTGGHGFRDQDRIDVTQRLLGFADCRDLPNITRGLVKRGYSDEQVRGILGENALRVFREICG